MIYINGTVRKILNLWVPLNYSNTVLIYCNKASIKGLLDCFDHDLEKNIENTAWNLENNVVYREIAGNSDLKRIMQIYEHN